jgi:uncharacterized protein YqjF (DUF2071 family)
VSLVAFTQRRLRPAFGGRVSQLLSAPLSDHAFLNVRTYVRHRGERGIHFLAEWIPNRLAAWIGPRTYGLPYRLGELDYRWNRSDRSFRGSICAGGGELGCSAELECIEASEPQKATAGSLSHFLLERYVAFTYRRDVRRRFAVRHAPWLQFSMTPTLHKTSLLDAVGFPLTSGRLCGAHASPGVRDVSISSPHRV